MANLMKSILSMQSKLSKIKDEAATSEYSAKVGDVEVLITGDRTVKRINIPGQDELADLITAALNKAGQEAEEGLRSKTKDALGPLGKFVNI